MNTSRLSAETYKKGLVEGDRVVLARAITLIESTLPADQEIAGRLLDSIMPETGNSLRIGITGAPGVGKSTFIEAFGKVLVNGGKKLAVLTIDPSSQLTRGSILGDKTRMAELARDERAFIRPSPSGQTLGGVASHTRETLLLCEAAGFDVIIIETVGTGQSEITVRNMVDFFLLLMQPGSGDELQGIKKGVVEIADAIVVTKADGVNREIAQATLSDFQHALHLLKEQPSGWTPRVLLSSALDGSGMPDVRDMIEEFRTRLSASGYLAQNRQRQYVSWFQEHFQYLLALDPVQHSDVLRTRDDLVNQIGSGELSPRHAAQKLLSAYHETIRRKKG